MLAIAPICNSINCALGKEDFTSYLRAYESNVEQWKMNNATELVLRWIKGLFPRLINVGTSNEFCLEKQLLPEIFAKAANMSCVGQSLVIRYQEVNYSMTI